MRKIPTLWGIHAHPTKASRIMLGLLPFVILVAVYLIASYERHKENPQDKLLPTVSKMVESTKRMAFEEDVRSGNYLMASDTIASLKRLGIGMGISAIIGLFLGMNMGLFKGMQSITLPFVTFVSIIPPLAILPILFVTFGVDELAKVMLIIIGVAPLITLGIYQYVAKIPREQITKSLTLGASQLGIVYRIVLPQTMPRLVDAIRLSLGTAWLFLIAAEAIASTEGLGYRIFLVRRYMSMDVIIPYVLWITLLGYLIDLGLRYFVSWRYRWYIETQ